MNIARAISEKWRKMGPRERESWEEKAHRDKARYMFEKDQFEGPWKVPANKRKPKDPTSPKKPVPAYFAFSNARRQQVKNDNPSATNAEVSKLLSNMWKEAPEELRNQYLEEEAARRKVYAVTIGEWRQENELKKKAEEEARSTTEQALKNAAPQISQDGSSEGARSQRIGGSYSNDDQMTLEDQGGRASVASSSQNSMRSSIQQQSRQRMPQIELGLGVPTAAVQQFAWGNASSLGNNGGGQGHGSGQQTMSSNSLVAALTAMSGNRLAAPLVSATTNITSGAPAVPAFNSNITNNTNLGEGDLSQVIAILLSGGQLGRIAQTPAPPPLQQYSQAADSQQQSLMLLQSLLTGHPQQQQQQQQQEQQQQQQQQQQNFLVQQLGQQSEQQQHQFGGSMPLSDLATRLMTTQPGQFNLSTLLANQQGTNNSQNWNDQGQQAQQRQQLRNPQNTFQHHQPPRKEDERYR
jgi:hypothetical protein